MSWRFDIHGHVANEDEGSEETAAAIRDRCAQFAAELATDFGSPVSNIVVGSNFTGDDGWTEGSDRDPVVAGRIAASQAAAPDDDATAGTRSPGVEG